jgi:hypothetical protein
MGATAAARGSVAIALAAAAAVTVPGAGAKGFEPGDVRICGATTCRAVVRPAGARALGAFIYTGRQPAVAARPALGAPTFQLRYDNGYVAGILAGVRRDRFLSYGVYLERFRRGSWYRLSPAAAREVRLLTTGLRPRRLTVAALRRSR